MIPTTFEMDGLFTKEDIDNRNIVMAQCVVDFEYSRWDKDKGEFKCSYCGGEKHVYNSGVSLRTFNPATHNKTKKPKRK